MSPEFQAYRSSKYQTPPTDFPWNPQGFKRDVGSGSDISAHLPMLEYFASLCDAVGELGSRNAFSTVAFLSGARQQVISIDIQPTVDTQILLDMQKVGQLPAVWEFRCQSSIDPDKEIGPVDALLIDSLHTYSHVKQELKIHTGQVNRWLFFHDWYSQREKSLDVPGETGIGPAVEEFIAEHPEWVKCYEVFFNHGLLILERKL